MGENANMLEVSCHHRVLLKKFAGCDSTAIGTRLLVDQKLRDERLKTGKMVKQEDIALLYLSVGVDFYFDTKHFFDGVKYPY